MVFPVLVVSASASAPMAVSEIRSAAGDGVCVCAGARPLGALPPALLGDGVRLWAAAAVSDMFARPVLHAADARASERDAPCVGGA